MSTAILAIIYYEPDWSSGTMTDIANFCPGYPLFLQDRKGYDSLAKAINQGFIRNELFEFDYVWVLTNIRFGAGCLQGLEKQMESHLKFAAIHPCFDSDHEHLQVRLIFQPDLIEGPFVEFTAPLVRARIFRDFPLDETMPYSGHDLDWGYRVRDAGYRIGVYHGVRIQHRYIRFNRSRHPITIQRAALRQQMEAPTKARLEQKYGAQWFEKLRCKY